jgi:hypothetical protein
MTDKLNKVLLATCAILALVIVGEWRYAQHAQNQVWAEINGVKINPYQVAELPSLALADKAEESYADLVGRPLFTKGRRYIEGASVNEDGSTIGVDAEFEWQLTGIYTKGNGLYALFDRAQDHNAVGKTKHQKITEGGSIQGWRLATINQDSVILEQASGQKVLMLRKPKSKQTPDKPNFPPKLGAAINPQDSDNENP